MLGGFAFAFALMKNENKAERLYMKPKIRFGD